MNNKVMFEYTFMCVNKVQRLSMQNCIDSVLCKPDSTTYIINLLSHNAMQTTKGW